MKKLLLVAFLASSLMSLQSCGGDDSVTPNGGGNNNGGNNGGGGNTTTANLPIEIELNYGKLIYEYDSTDRFHKVTFESKGSTDIITEFTYSNDVLTELKQTIGPANDLKVVTHSFTYSNNIVNVTIDDDYSYNIRQIFTDNQGISLKTIYTSSRFNTIYNEEYSYDNNKNMISFKIDKTTQGMKYDTSNGIFKNVKMPQWSLFYSLFHINKVLALTINNNPIEISLGPDPYIFQYTYNIDNYPITYNSNYYGETAKVIYSK